MVSLRFLSAAWLVMFLFVAGGVSLRQPVTDSVLSSDELASRLAAVEADTSLPEDARESAASMYRDAMRALERLATRRDAREQAVLRASEAPGLLDSIRAELATPAAKVEIAVDAQTALDELEQRQSAASAELRLARETVNELQAEVTRRRDRRAAISDELAQARAKLDEIDGLLQSAPSVGEAETVATARRVMLTAQRASASALIAALDAELANFDARRELLPARLDLALRRASAAEEAASAWQVIVSDRRQAEADRAAREAREMRRQAAGQHPVLQRFAAKNQELAEQRAGAAGVLPRTTRAEQDAADARARLQTLRDQYGEVRRRIAVSGLNRATGRLLRRHYERLGEVADEDVLRRQIREVERALEDGEYALVERQEERVGAGDVDAVVRSLLAEVEGEGGASDMAGIESAARELAVSRRDLLDELIGDLTTYVDEALFELDVVARDLLAALLAYETFIKERILGVRSIERGQRPSLADVREGVASLADPSGWSRALRKSGTTALSTWLVVAPVAAFVVLVIAIRRPSRRRLKGLAELVRRYATDSYWYTIRALLFTLVTALPYPSVLWVVGWLLTRPLDQEPFAVVLGDALKLGAWTLLPFSFLSALLRPDGLGDAHFRWAMTSMRPVRRHLRWFVPIVVPMVVLSVFFDRFGAEGANATLGRSAFTVGLLALAVFVYLVLRPGGPLLSAFMQRHPGGWITRLRALWFSAFIGLPLGLVVTAWLGYYYTASQIEERLDYTLILVLLMVLVNALLVRWLFIARRHVAVEDARRRREQAAEDASRAAGEDAPTESTVPPLDVEKLDLPAVSAQSHQLIRTSVFISVLLGLFFIWADVFPALRMLDRVEVWPTVQMRSVDVEDAIPILEAEETGASSAAPASSVVAGEDPASDENVGDPERDAADSDEASALVSVTLRDVGLSLIFVLATVVAFRNLPGLVEIMVLQKLPLDAGSRYALSTVLRYLIAIIGIAAACSAIGLSWTRVQWLAAALTFGLGFGLQEIFANFVSGLIILGERPIRIGDTVTVGQTTGTVTRIRMRATTITDWDRKELVIPNKMFITGEVINWTLSDPVLRVTIPVGVSYGADVRRTESLLLEIAEESSTVLDEPKPHVVFRNFGASTLDFEVRVFIAHIDHLIAIRHEMHMAITERFREAGIEIAFPQRDLHIRSIGELGEIMKRADAVEPPHAELES